MDSLSEPIVAVAPSVMSTAPARRVARWPIAISALVCGASVYGLKAVDYSTSTISRVSEAEVRVAPPAAAVLGPVRWDFEAYTRAPSLAVFREVFGSQCGAQRGVEAARCVTKVLSDASPHGQGTSEFVDSGFDPSTAIRAHMSGAPGNCTARSAMASTALLSMGVPARVVQLLPANRAGHNALEVYDDEKGWVLFDPLFKSSYLVNGEFASALTLSAANGDVTWRRPHDGAPDPNEFAGSTIQYPEPWLYTRVGERCGSWPFRACFAQVGPQQFRYGPLQRSLFFSILATAFFAAVWLVRVVLDRRQAARS